MFVNIENWKYRKTVRNKSWTRLWNSKSIAFPWKQQSQLENKTWKTKTPFKIASKNMKYLATSTMRDCKSSAGKIIKLHWQILKDVIKI